MNKEKDFDFSQIEEAWNSYRKNVLHSIQDEKLDGAKMVFCAGAMSCLSLIQGLSILSIEEAKKQINKLNNSIINK